MIWFVAPSSTWCLFTDGTPPAPLVRRVRIGLGLWTGLGLSTARYRRVG